MRFLNECKKIFFAVLFYTVFLGALPYVLLEGLSATLLTTGAVPNGYPILFEKFPAQFRMSAKELETAFGPLYQMPTEIGHFYEVSFDPAMGFRNDTLAFTWHGGDAADAKGKFVVVALGGSTTYGDNWPNYLPKYAEAENVAEKLLVLNAGHPGFMSFNQKIYLTSWVWPKLNRLGIKPDLVVSMDGVNDIHFRVESYSEFKKTGASVWLSHYHGYQQKLAYEFETLNTFSGSLAQTVTKLLKKDTRFARYFPYTIAMLSGLSKQQQTVRNDAHLHLENDGARQSIFRLPDAVQGEIMEAYRASLLDLAGASQIRGAGFAGYLQPILLEKYHPRAYRFKYPGIRMIFKDATYQAWWLGLQGQLGGFYRVDVDPLYDKAEGLYRDLMNRYPKNFGNLIYLFKDVDAPLYQDPSHYTTEGAELMAHAVIKDLIAKGYLTVNAVE